MPEPTPRDPITASYSRFREMESILGARREEVEWFSMVMEQTLRQNDYKGGWIHAGFTQGDAMKRLYQEVRELSDARADKEPADRIIKEASDVANFALMVADRARRGLP